MKHLGSDFDGREWADSHGEWDSTLAECESQRRLPINAPVKFGKCRRCARRLSNPSSVKAGIGPTCAKKERHHEQGS